MTDHTHPEWHDLAQHALARLQTRTLSRMHPDTSDEFGEDEPRIDEQPLPEAKAKRRIIAHQDSKVKKKRPTKARVPKPKRAVQPRELVLLYRFCATFETQEEVDGLLEPGAMTLVETGDASLQALVEIIEKAAFSHKVVFGSDLHLPRGAPGSALVAVTLRDPEYKRETNERTARIISTLELPFPVLILAPNFAEVPKDVLKCFPAPRRLANISNDVLTAVLNQVYSSSGSEMEQVQQVLSNQVHDVSWPALASALRERDALSCAKRLKSLTAQDAQEGPTLDDIEGYGAAEDAARQMVGDLTAWRDGDLNWSEVQRSVLFHGAPGTGKSFLASAMGNSAGVSLVRSSFAKWQATGHLGDMLKSMRETFNDAAQARPAILVIDEIDALGDRASPDKHSQNYTHQVINGFLEAMDGLKDLEGLMVVGTCNFPERIDAAALRPGRFDMKVEVPLPGTAALRRMLCVGFPDQLSEADLGPLVSAAAGRSAAEVDGAFRAARTRARSENRPLQQRDLLVQFGAEDRNPALDYRIAIHECGHAIVHYSLGMGRVKRVALTTTGGGTWLRSAPVEGLLSDCENQLTHLLAGRAAERLVLGVPTAGAGGSETSDLARATQKAVAIDTKLGLGAEGLAWVDLDQDIYLRDPQNAKRVRGRLEKAETQALAILSQHKALLRGMGDDLFTARMLEGDALEVWLLKVDTDSGEWAQDRTSARKGLDDRSRVDVPPNRSNSGP